MVTTGRQNPSTGGDRQLIALAQVLQTLRETTEQRPLIEATLAYLQAEIVDYRVLWLLLYDRAKHSLLGQGGKAPDLGNQNFLYSAVPLKSGDLLEQIVLQQRSLIVPNLREEARGGALIKIAQVSGIQGAMIFPIHHEKICYGLVLLGSERWGILARSEEKALLGVVLGQLASSLHRWDQAQSHQSQKQAERPLLQVIQGLPIHSTLGDRIRLILESVHGFLEPTQTAFYRYEPQGRYFTQESLSSQSRTPRKRPGSESVAPTLEVQGHLKFYKALTSNNLISASTVQSTLPPDATQALLTQVQGRSFLAAPLMHQGQILGFLSAQTTDPRIWTEEEKQLLQGAAQLLALVSPLETIEQDLARQHQGQKLLMQVSHAIRSDQDWQSMVAQVGPLLGNYFQADRVALMVFEPEEEVFSIGFQHKRDPKAKDLPAYWSNLSEVDWRLLEQVEEGVALESVADDLRLLAWRDDFLEGGIQSVLACGTLARPPQEGALILGCGQPRTWSHDDRRLACALGQHLGQALRQWRLQQDWEHQQHLYQVLQWGLTTIQQAADVETLEQTVTAYIGQVIQAPMAALVTWKPRRPVGKFAAIAATTEDFALPPKAQISLADVLIQQILASDGLLRLSIDQITPDTRQWLSAPSLERLVAVALRTTPEDEPLGVMIVGDRQGAHWSERSLSVVGVLATELAWYRRNLTLLQRLNHSQNRLRQLSWYKHYRFIELRRLMENSQGQLAQGLQELAPLAQTALPKATLQTLAKVNQRCQQSAGQLGQALTEALQIVRYEQWQLQFYQRQMPLASFLKRSLVRVDPLVKQRHLWVQIHAEDNLLELSGDVGKLEGILYQMLVLACHRSPEQGRIDVWCRLVDSTTLDLSITDGGHLEPYMLQELQQGRERDALAPSTLDQPPGLLLAICQSLLADMGGTLEFYTLEDDRTLSRLVLPFITPKDGGNPPQF